MNANKNAAALNNIIARIEFVTGHMTEGIKHSTAGEFWSCDFTDAEIVQSAIEMFNQGWR